MCQLQLQSKKQTCIYTNTGYRPGRHLNELLKKKKEAHFAAVIISVTGVSTEDSKNKGDIQLQ